MKGNTFGKFIATALVFSGILLSVNAQSVLTVLHNFTATPASSPYTNGDGTYPRADLIQSGSTLYGTASQGGILQYGAIFSINTSGASFTNLHSFALSEGSVLYGGLVLAGNTLYGVASGGGSNGSGSIFSINTNGLGFTVQYSFSPNVYSASLNTYTNADGSRSFSTLVLSGNTLYGTASGGGLFGKGTVYAFNTNNLSFTNLYNFSTSTTNGALPGAGLVLSGNTLYGTTGSGGANGNGAVFRINTDGTGFTNLYSFTAETGVTNSDGANPEAALVLSGDTLFGTTRAGGGDFGTVFSINTNGAPFSVLHTFTLTAGSNMDGILPISDLFIVGNILFGTSQMGGSALDGNVFTINTNGNGFKNLYSFTATANSTNADGAVLQAGVILSSNTLYGVASQGGSAGRGTVFALKLIPSLGIASASNQVVLSWPTWAPNYELQTAPNLSSGNWSNITSGITIAGLNNVFTNAVNGQTAFFRLH